MRQFYLCRIFFIVLAMVSLSACSHTFEISADVQARQALFDLMAIQDAYYKENKKYARNLLQIEKYNLKYHTGIVYLEIESADRDGYRAISLPAESTTARVFAYDSAKGGFYEMGDKEVSKYVLGALNHIRGEQSKQNLVDISSFLLVGMLLVLGLRFIPQLKAQENRIALATFFLGLVPLSWTVALLNHINPDLVISSLIQGMTVAALLSACLSLIMIGVWAGRRNLHDESASLLSLLGCTGIMSLFSGGILIYQIMIFYKP